MMDVRTRLTVDDLLVVANTRHGPGGHHGLRGRAGQPMHDHLEDPTDARSFLADHRVAVPQASPTAADLESLRLIRGHVRTLAGDDAGDSADEARIRQLFERYPVSLGPDGELHSAGDLAGWAVLVADLLPPLVEVRRERARLRLCGNPLCRFMFIDRSRNASRVWCEGSVCGNRVRGHRHRLRRLAG